MTSEGGDREGASPIGCVIAMDGVVVGAGHNEVGHRHDPTAHAEIVAIRRACRSLGRDDLRSATLYSTLQPRGMCSMASIWCSIRRLAGDCALPLYRPENEPPLRKQANV